MKVTGKIYFYTKEYLDKNGNKIFFLAGMLHNELDKSTSWYDLSLVSTEVGKKEQLYQKLEDKGVYNINIIDGFLSSKFIKIKDKTTVRHVIVVKDWDDKICKATAAEIKKFEEYKEYAKSKFNE